MKYIALAALACLCLWGSRAQANIIYDNADGITQQPSDDIRWNSTGSFGIGGGVVIAPSYFLSAQHLGSNSTFTLTTDIGGVTSSQSYTTVAGYDIPNTDLRVWKIAGTFPQSSIVPLYSGPAGSEAGQKASFIGFGYHQQGAAVTSTYNGNTVQNGWLWGGTAVKNFGQNDINQITNDAPGGAPTLNYTFDPLTGQNESIFTVGDSGGGTFIFNTATGRYELAGINYGISQYFTQQNAGSAVNAAIYDARGLYVSDGTNFYDAATVNNGQFLHQNGYSSEIAPYESQIDAVTGVPEPASVGLLLLACAPALLRRQMKNEK